MATRTIGILFPLHDDQETNRLFKMDLTAMQTVRSQLYFLLTTPKGTRWYNPEFGTLLRRYMFEPNDAPTWDEVERDINDSVARFMPNTTIKKIDFLQGPSPQTVLLTIHFTYTEKTYAENSSITITFSNAS